MAQGADVVLRASARDLAESAAYFQNRTRKGGYRLESPAPGFASEPVTLYDGKERFLVRTALVRHEGFRSGRSPSLNTPRRVAELCRHLAAMDQEYMVTIAVDAGLHLVAIHETAIGQRSRSGVAAVDVVKIPLLTSSPAAFLVHNHPSGDATPSPEDLTTTELARKAVASVGLTLLDHVIVATEGWYSLMSKELGFEAW